MGISSTTYRSTWNTGKTKLIRVPEALADEVLAYAHYLDAQKGDEDVEDPAGVYAAPREKIDTRKPINVASVPLRSPFRYPGGKTWLVPYIRAWLSTKETKPSLFIEPFAGGGICSLTVAFESLADHALLAELDENVAAVWKTLLTGQGEWLATRILDFECRLEHVQAALRAQTNSNPLSMKEKAFLTILRNRVQRGGIMAPGAGLVKSGENGRGIASRWYPDTLARRIREIDWHRNRMTFVDGDGMDLIAQYKGETNCVCFADPPYTQAARRLYDHWQFDHRSLFELLAQAKGDFLLSYDNTEEIQDLAREFGFPARAVCMKNTHHAKMTELLIGRDFAWLDGID